MDRWDDPWWIRWSLIGDMASDKWDDSGKLRGPWTGEMIVGRWDDKLKHFCWFYSHLLIIAGKPRKTLTKQLPKLKYYQEISSLSSLTHVFVSTFLALNITQTRICPTRSCNIHKFTAADKGLNSAQFDVMQECEWLANLPNFWWSQCCWKSFHQVRRS